MVEFKFGQDIVSSTCLKITVAGCKLGLDCVYARFGIAEVAESELWPDALYNIRLRANQMLVPVSSSNLNF